MKKLRKEYPILPCGTLNVKTGENKYFNVKENGESTTEVWKVEAPDQKVSYRFVTTSGKSSIGEKSLAEFVHDQTGRHLFFGTMIDSAREYELEKLSQYKGKRHYVYK